MAGKPPPRAGTPVNVTVPDAQALPEAADPLVGTVILEQFEVQGKIGDGGYGKVYLARQVGVDRRAVIKVLQTATDEDGQTVLKRFEREARVLAALDSPHLVKLYNFGNLPDGRAFLAMEYGGDVNLADELKRLRRLPPARALLIAEQICEALHEAHSHGVIHRDLKPHNILLGHKDGQEWVKVVDLGIARLMDAAELEDNGAKLTAQGIVIGTPAYFSPEQCHGVGLDGRSDLYTLGLVLYEMLAGKLPLSGVTAVDYVRAHVVDSPTPLRQHLPDAPAWLETMVMKALQKKPDARYASALEMRDAVRAARERLRADRPSRTRTQAAVRKRDASRWPWLALGASAVAVAGAGLAWFALAEASPPPAATLVIHATPGTAELLLDGRRIAAGRHHVSPGRHKLVGRADGFVDDVEEFEVAPRQQMNVDLTLMEASQ